MESVSEKLKTYFALMHQSLNLMEKMEAALDAVYRSSMKMEHESTHEANNDILGLTQQLSSLHDARLAIASEFGCTGEKFSFELASKLPPKVGQQLTQISTQLMERMTRCQEKMTIHSEQLQLQKQIVSDAVESLNLTVSA